MATEFAKIFASNAFTRQQVETLRRLITYASARLYVGRGTTAERPSLLPSDAGVMYLDNTLAAAGKPIWWNGTAWVDATGTVV